MLGLIEFIARNLVDDPNSVGVYEIRNDRYATVGLHVAGEDPGKHIGRQGASPSPCVRSCARRARCAASIT